VTTVLLLEAYLGLEDQCLGFLSSHCLSLAKDAGNTPGVIVMGSP
jgi:hypothetical protein